MSGEDGSLQLRLDPTPESVPEARRFVLSHAAVDDPDVVQTLALLVSELVSNAVLHAGTSVVIRVEQRTDSIRVDVIDESSVFPRLKSYGVEAVTGRGLQFVDALSRRWGVVRRSPGKSVWFELPREMAETR